MLQIQTGEETGKRSGVVENLCDALVPVPQTAVANQKIIAAAGQILRVYGGDSAES